MLLVLSQQEQLVFCNNLDYWMWYIFTNPFMFSGLQLISLTQVSIISKGSNSLNLVTRSVVRQIPLKLRISIIVIASQTEWLHEEGDLISLCQINFPQIINTPPLHFNTSGIFWLRHLDILLWKLAPMWKCVFNDWHTIKKTFIPLCSVTTFCNFIGCDVFYHR